MTEKAQNTQPRIAINAQYVKDLSFENPGAPDSLIAASKEHPKVDLSLNIGTNPLHGNTTEVSLQITVKATVKDKPVFMAEVVYAGLFTLENIPEQEKEPVTLIYCPNILFPFARRLVADITRDGGFPPVMLDPIDFATLYNKQKQQTAGNG